ncbi:exocyst complex component 3-like protein 4 [Discoglossus pictus]
MSYSQNNGQVEPDKSSPIKVNEDHKGGLMESFRRNVIRKSKRLSKGPVEENKSPEKKETPNERMNLTSKIRNSLRVKTAFRTAHDEEELQGVVEEEKSANNELLSVMQINELIQEKDFKKAFFSITLMEDTLLKEYSNNYYKDNIKEYTRQAKDVNMLYESLFKVMKSIVKDSVGQEKVDEQLMSSVVHVINEEGKAWTTIQGPGGNSETPVLGQPRKWRKLWEEAIKESVNERIGAVPVSQTDSTTWLAEHLELLKTNTVQDLLKVKHLLKPLYPKEYDVYRTYVRCFHSSLSSHLQDSIVPLDLQFGQLYCLLDWTINTYTSDSFLGDPDLRPDINISTLLDAKCHRKLKQDYNCALQETIKRYLNNILELEKVKWEEGLEPEAEALQDSCLSPIYMDIEEMIGKHVRQSAKLSEDLEISSFLACMEELGGFTSRLESEFINWSEGRFSALTVQYLVVYVNSFIKLRNNTNQSNADQSKQAGSSLTRAIEHLRDHFFKLFKMETQPYFQKLITKNWLSSDAAFGGIMKATTQLYSSLRFVIEPLDKDFQHGVHKYLIKEYISQIMKRKTSLKRLKRKKAAEKMSQEAEELNCALKELGSDLNGLLPAIQCISEIIALSKQEEIKKKVDILHRTYPDIEEQHLLSILYLQGIKRSKKLSVRDYFRELKKKEAQTPEKAASEGLFSDIECSTQVGCLCLII